MKASRRSAVLGLVVPFMAAAAGQQSPSELPLPTTETETRDKEDDKLPNGKSQRDAIAKAEHASALKNADRLIELAQEIKSDLEKAGSFVVPLATVKKTEEVEKLARKIRGRLKS